MGGGGPPNKSVSIFLTVVAEGQVLARSKKQKLEKDHEQLWSTNETAVINDETMTQNGKQTNVPPSCISAHSMKWSLEYWAFGSAGAT